MSEGHFPRVSVYSVVSKLKQRFNIKTKLVLFVCGSGKWDHTRIWPGSLYSVLLSWNAKFP